MKKKLALLIVTCSILVSVFPPILGTSPMQGNPNPPINRTFDHGLGT
jgi:hypothetical protein